MRGTDERAETLAEYLEHVQWRVQLPDTALPTGAKDDELHVNLGPILLAEVQRVVKKLRRGRAAGPDEVPPDLWQALLVPYRCA